MRRKRNHNLLLLIVLLTFFIVLGQEKLSQESKQNRDLLDFSVSDKFRKLQLSSSMVAYLRQNKKNIGRDVGLYLLEKDNKKVEAYRSDDYDQLEKDWKETDGWSEYQKVCDAIWGDLQYFPIPVAVNDASATISYCDSWMYDRNYRSNSTHEGTDIMADQNIRGYYPVISMTDGVVTNLGWLELGGYRVGITSPGGTYFYYAHLASYANLKEGMKIQAGDLLGFMGDSGYGKEEGTVGKFPVHLHVGIYLYPNGKEISYNPYWILKYLEEKRIKCRY